MTNSEALEITKGNQYAADFVMAYIDFCHLVDDVIDKDKEVNVQRLSSELITFLESVMINPWVREHSITLWPLIVTGCNAWVDSDIIALKNRKEADVVKGVYHEVVWFVSYLCGGWEHLRATTTKYREYQYEGGM